MDKKKTGELIKEARLQKNYTQSELGDILGVSNKAVSRWENGESFPDVGLLENISNVLGLEIKNIVTGEAETCEETAVTEVIRAVKIQSAEKRKKNIIVILFCIVIFLTGLTSYYCLGIGSTSIFNNITEIIITMVISYLLLMYCAIKCSSIVQYKFVIKRLAVIIAACSLTWIIILMGIMLFSVSRGIIPFGMKLASVGPFINWQLIIAAFINYLILVLSLLRLLNSDEGITLVSFINLLAIFIANMYGDLLHRLSSVETVFKEYSVRTMTCVSVFTLVIFLYYILIKHYKSAV